ncbi:DNA-binding transcriptional regulator, MarR family [bacterium A37T11]|nr:DNA-binding transcriptional regulator, MarR family [bacterium A37T11]
MSDNTVDYYLKTTWQSIANKYNQIAAEYQITQANGFVLINIHSDGTPVSKIASLLGVKTTSLSRMLSNMEVQGWIYRQIDPDDKRSVRVFLTDEGLKKRALVKDVVRQFSNYLDEHISKTERVRLIKLLKRLNQLALNYKPEA